MSRRRVCLAVWLFLIAFLAHAPALLGVFPGALPATGDATGQFAPWHEFVRRNLAQNGAIPLWNPHIYCGMPFAANGQSALFYPPNYLHFLLPENFAIWLFALLHSYFLLLGGAFLGRTLGLSRRAALLVGLLVALGNATPAHLFGGHLTFLPARAFWPWQAAFLIRLLRSDASRGDARSAIALAACLALGLAAGAPQIWLFGLIFCGAITVFWMIRALQNRVAPANWPWKSGFLALFLAALWCAPLLLPLQELKNWSSRGEMLSFANVTDLSATPRSLFRLGFNNFFGGNSFSMWSLPANPGEDGASIGLAPGLLALAAPFFVKSRRARALFWGCALVLLLALGNATPLYRALYDHFTLFQITRVPARWLELWAFGAAILAGIGFDAALSHPKKARGLLPLWTGAALFCLALGAGVFWSQSPWQYGAQIVARALDLSPAKQSEIAAGLQSDALLACVLGFLALGALIFLTRRPISTKNQGALFLAALCAEPLANFWLSVRITPPENMKNAQIPVSIARKFRAGERWIVRAPFHQLNAPLSAGIDTLNGYEPLGSAPFFALAREAQPDARFSADFQPRKMDPLWRIMGASHLLWKPKFDGDEPRGFFGPTVAREREWHLISLQDGLKPWPRAYLTRQIVRADDLKTGQILRELAAQPFAIAPPAVVSTALEMALNIASNPPISARERVRIRDFSPDARRWEIEASRASFFVENEALAPGWKVWVDAKPARMERVNGMFRGVAVPRGAREIAMVYDSQTLRFALFLAGCGLGLAAFCWTSRRPPKTRPEDARKDSQ